MDLGSGVPNFGLMHPVRSERQVEQSRGDVPDCTAIRLPYVGYEETVDSQDPPLFTPPESGMAEAS